MFKIKKNSNKDDSEISFLYDRLIKLFYFISIILILLIIIIALGYYILELESNWALLNLENWILICILVISIFIILEIVFYLHYKLSLNKVIEFIETPPEYIHGKQLYVYTSPKGSKGGVFSKTYILLDENSVLRLRYCIVPPEEIWNKVEK